MDDIRILVAIDFETIYSGNAVEVYLAQMRKLIQETLKKKGRCPTVKFPQQVDFVLTISAEWPSYTTKVLRECAYKTGFEFTSHNEFTTEHSFLVADCGGGTVDLTLRKLLLENKLLSERIKSPYLFEPFEHQVPIIAAVPALSMAAIVRGAITYGFNIDIVHDRILKWTHGIEVCRS
ncbi:hypothetical protein RhiirC2_714794 [Rhizophagus irregularis]|uniref:Uncharacterized protein n=1 Tax=Rhizophagus irregularis TaxID=588596 RepID=A0A2N1MXZ8_9GLOM|nr:hypothetical protein RhiirC2_714794 [Rhizophagus irregularis]